MLGSRQPYAKGAVGGYAAKQLRLRAHDLGVLADQSLDRVSGSRNGRELRIQRDLLAHAVAAPVMIATASVME